MKGFGRVLVTIWICVGIAWLGSSLRVGGRTPAAWLQRAGLPRAGGEFKSWLKARPGKIAAAWDRWQKSPKVTASSARSSLKERAAQPRPRPRAVAAAPKRAQVRRPAPAAKAAPKPRAAAKAAPKPRAVAKAAPRPKPRATEPSLERQAAALRQVAILQAKNKPAKPATPKAQIDERVSAQDRAALDRLLGAR